ncbi:MAG TPA: extracellular solute-binding protein [Anaerolineales bacterium]
MLTLAFLVACQPATLESADANATGAPRATSTAVESGLAHAIPPDSLQGTGIQVWHPWYGVEASLLDAQASEFNKENEWGITVRTSGSTSFTELFDAVNTALAGDQGPQLIIALPEHAIAWDAGGHVTDLSAYVGDAAYGLENSAAADFPAVFWNQDVVAGRRVGVPAQRSARFLLYNQTWAKKLGFYDSPSSESEFRTQACAAHTELTRDEDPANDGLGGWLVDTNAMTFLSWLTAFGGGALDGEGYRFLSPRNLEAAVYLKQLYDEGCAWLPQAGSDNASAFASRKALFATSGLEELSAYTRAMAQADNADTWTVLSFPGPVQTGLIAYGSSFVVLKSTPAQQLASWLFIRWMLSPENQKRWVEATGLFPLRSSEMDLLADYQKSHPQWAAAVEHIPDTQLQPQLISWRQVRVMLGDGFDAMFRSNTPAGRVAEILAIMDRTAADLSQ